MGRTPSRQSCPTVRIRLLWAIVSWIAVAVVAGCQSDDDAARPGVEPRRPNGIAIPTQGRFVLVNIPDFELVALEDGRPVLRSRVIVGKPATATPQLLSSMYAVKFNPSWTPTPAMVRAEGARPAPPGPNNPLGQILFELDNDRLIYLHDTNDRSLFDRADRALSHGCVRVQRARALAAWALRTTEREVAEMIATGATRTVPLSTPIPVLLSNDLRFPKETPEANTHSDWHGPIDSLVARDREQPITGGCRPAL